jgi:hypothetical protein
MWTYVRSRAGAGVLLISAGMLAFEIGLSRAFAVQQFHHFAFLVISLAVMGLAASGTLLAVVRRRPALASLALAYAASALAAYGVVNWLPFDSYSIAWDSRQVPILLLYMLAAFTPFVFAGWAVGACVIEAENRAHRAYATNLAGSALGCLLALGAQAAVGVEGALLLAAAAGFLAAAALSTTRLPRLASAVLAGGLVILAAARPAALELNLSPYKPLSQALLLPDARRILTRWSASARADVVETASLHAFPGLSLNADVDLPVQAALFLDGDGPLPITALNTGGPAASRLADSLPTGLAYRLRPAAAALILQPGAGLEAQLALAAGAERVDLPVDEPLAFDLLRGPLADLSLDLLWDPRVVLLGRSGRGALAAQGNSYDLVILALSDPFRPVAAGAFSLTEYYALTWEALYDAYARLAPDGILVLTRWLGTPPSEAGRAWATLLLALNAQGIDDPGPFLVAYRSMRTATILAARRPFTVRELSEARAFLERNGFDPIWLPDLRPEELNLHNRLPRDVYYELFLELLSRPQVTLAENEFNLTPPSDSRPYFFHYFRWRQTPQVIAALGTQWLPFGGSGYLVLLVLLAITTALAAGLALAPALAGGRPPEPALPGGQPPEPGSSGGLAAPRSGGQPPRGRASPGGPVLPRPRSGRPASRLPRRWLAYFACLGAGYLWIEIPLMQRLTLLLDRPGLALALVLFTLLMASGIGSLLSDRLPLRSALAGLVGLLAVEIALLPGLVRSGLPWGFPARAVLAAAVTAPPGLLMGVPFAAGLRRLQGSSPEALPWAWAVNGAVSGVSGVLAALITLDWGFSVTMGLGALAYAGAWAALRRLERAAAAAAPA